MKTKRLYIFLCLMITTLTANSESVIYRYIDKSGKTVYTDKLIPSEKGRVDVLSNKSVILKKVIDKELSAEELQAHQTEILDQKKILAQNETQKQQDQALLVTYSNTGEIEKMKQYEMSQISSVIKNNQDVIDNLKARKEQSDKDLADIPKEKLPPFKQDENLKLEKELTRAQETLEKNKILQVQRERKYNDDKIRYEDLIKKMSDNKN